MKASQWCRSAENALHAIRMSALLLLWRSYNGEIGAEMVKETFGTDASTTSCYIGYPAMHLTGICRI
jgi:hypothetical protein